MLEPRSVRAPGLAADAGRQAAARWPRHRRVRTELHRGYEICMRADLGRVAAALGEQLAGRRGLILTTPTVRRRYGDALRLRLVEGGSAVELLELDCTESTKTWAQVERVAEAAQASRLDRRSVLVALSGGVASDIVTLAASVIRRGIAHLRVPTTLLAQCDAAVGIKGAVHLGRAKNHLGCFHPPERVLICPEFLGSLPVRQLRSGLAEMLKVAIAGEPELFAGLEESGSRLLDPRWHSAAPQAQALLWRSIEGLLGELEPNLYEDRTLVRSMDLGHTFSPWIESASEFRILHGEAVGMDMALSTALALELGWIEPGDAERVAALLGSVQLVRRPSLLDVAACRAAIEEAVRHRGGSLNLFLPTGVGRSRCLASADALDDGVLRRALARVDLWAGDGPLEAR